MRLAVVEVRLHVEVSLSVGTQETEMDLIARIGDPTLDVAADRGRHDLAVRRQLTAHVVPFGPVAALQDPEARELLFARELIHVRRIADVVVETQVERRLRSHKEGRLSARRRFADFVAVDVARALVEGVEVVARAVFGFKEVPLIATRVDDVFFTVLVHKREVEIGEIAALARLHEPGVRTDAARAFADLRDEDRAVARTRPVHDDVVDRPTVRLERAVEVDSASVDREVLSRKDVAGNSIFRVDADIEDAVTDVGLTCDAHVDRRRISVRATDCERVVRTDREVLEEAVLRHRCGETGAGHNKRGVRTVCAEAREVDVSGFNREGTARRVAIERKIAFAALDSVRRSGDDGRERRIVRKVKDERIEPFRNGNTDHVGTAKRRRIENGHRAVLKREGPGEAGATFGRGIVARHGDVRADDRNRAVTCEVVANDLGLFIATDALETVFTLNVN